MIYFASLLDFKSYILKLMTNLMGEDVTLQVVNSKLRSPEKSGETVNEMFIVGMTFTQK